MNTKQNERPAAHPVARTHVEAKPAKMTDAQKAKASLGALAEMVRQAEQSGQRDLPHVARAREVLDQAEDKPNG